MSNFSKHSILDENSLDYDPVAAIKKENNGYIKLLLKVGRINFLLAMLLVLIDREFPFLDTCFLFIWLHLFILPVLSGVEGLLTGWLPHRPVSWGLRVGRMTWLTLNFFYLLITLVLLIIMIAGFV